MVGRVVLILLYYCFTFKLVATEIFKKKKRKNKFYYFQNYLQQYTSGNQSMKIKRRKDTIILECINC